MSEHQASRRADTFPLYVPRLAEQKFRLLCAQPESVKGVVGIVERVDGMLAELDVYVLVNEHGETFVGAGWP